MKNIDFENLNAAINILTVLVVGILGRLGIKKMPTHDQSAEIVNRLSSIEERFSYHEKKHKEQVGTLRHIESEMGAMNAAIRE